MSIYSGPGDDGETTCLNGRRVSKNSGIIHFIGTIDELNSHLGLVKAMLREKEFIGKIQKILMKLMSHVSDPENEKYFITDREVRSLEEETDGLSRNIPEITGFILPGKSFAEARIQITRAVARRAERFFFAAKEDSPLCLNSGAYLNRLSDYLFILSQCESLVDGNFIN